MKFLLLALFVTAAVASPVPDDESGNIDVVVNGVPEGQALEISHLLEIRTQEKQNGNVVAASDVLEPFTAQGMAAMAADEPVDPVQVATDPVSPVQVVEESVSPVQVVEESVSPVQVVEESVSPAQDVEGLVVPVLIGAEPVSPVVEESVRPVQVVEESVSPVLVVEESVSPVHVVAEPVSPVQVVEEPVEVVDVSPVQVAEVGPALPAPAAQTGEVYNDGTVSMIVNTPSSGVLDTLQSWLSMAINYITSSGNVAQTSQIV